MSPNERWLFIVATAARLVFCIIVYVACLAFVVWQWFFDDKFMAVFGVLCASIGLPLITPSKDEIDAFQYLLKNPDEK